MSTRIPQLDEPVIYCEHCGSTKLKKQELKRCAGCSGVLYCSKECQKAAWPNHKSMCRLRLDSISELGYDTPLALRNALKEWVNINIWAVTMVVNAAVYLGGGWDVVHRSSHAAILHVLPAPHTADANPATAFRLLKTRLAHKDSHPTLRAGWEGATRECAEIAAGIRRNRAMGAHFAGVLPTVFEFENAGVRLVPLSQTLVFRPAVRHVPDCYTDEGTRAAFADLVQMCASAISGGFVFRKAGEAGKDEPELGYMVRRKKNRWEWERVPQTWVCYPYRGANRISKLDAWQLLTLFNIF
ncbi:hypothetical protein C8Q76DRAFT_463932 [Earliella scabrosa]|nr:hypothetical protein C8Q76DRAFT_463932 [Earliella scabrosa]